MQPIVGCLSRLCRETVWRGSIGICTYLPPLLLLGLASFARVLLLLLRVAIILLAQGISCSMPRRRVAVSPYDYASTTQPAVVQSTNRLR